MIKRASSIAGLLAAVFATPIDVVKVNIRFNNKKIIKHLINI